MIRSSIRHTFGPVCSSTPTRKRSPRRSRSQRRCLDDPDVLVAFEALKASPSIRLVVTPQTEVIQSAVIGNRKIVLEDHLATPSVPEGLRFLRGVDVHRVVDLAGKHDQVPDLFESYNRTCPPVPLPDFLGVLSLLLAKGVLRNDAV